MLDFVALSTFFFSSCQLIFCQICITQAKKTVTIIDNCLEDFGIIGREVTIPTIYGIGQAKDYCSYQEVNAVRAALEDANIVLKEDKPQYNIRTILLAVAKALDSSGTYQFIDANKF